MSILSEAKKAVLDSFANMMTGVGLAKYDKMMHRQVLPGAELPYTDLDNLYRFNGFARKIVDRPVSDALRQGFEFRPVEARPVNDEFQRALARLRFTRHARRLLCWDRAYGGALMVVAVDDGLELSEPVNEAGIRRVLYLETYDKESVQPWKYDEDALSENFGRPKTYLVSPQISSGAHRPQFEVHHTRCVVLDGLDVPHRTRAIKSGWGDSIIQLIYDRLRGLSGAYQSVERIIDEFILGVFKMEDLFSYVEQGREDVLVKRLREIDRSKSVMNSVLIDKEEEFERLASTVTGLEGLLTRLEIALAAVGSQPATLLMGQSPSGMDATGESDLKLYYDLVKDLQRDKLRPVIERVARYVALSLDDEFRGTGPVEPAIEFASLWQPTDKERAEIRKLMSEADTNYVTVGVLTEEQVAEARFGGDEYTLDLSIDIDEWRRGREQTLEERAELARQLAAQKTGPDEDDAKDGEE